VSIRVTVVLVFCAALLASRVFGLHAHIAHPDVSASAEHAHVLEHVAHDEHVIAPAAEGATGHLDAHLEQGDVDLDEPASVAGKLTFLKAPAAIVGLLYVLFLSVFHVSAPAFQPPDRPPKFRIRPYLFPPSQAPPRAA
jgi:hypothetical protein